MFDLIESLKKLTAAARTRDLVGVLAAAGEVLTHAAALKKAWDGPAVVGAAAAHQGELADSCDELEECRRECTTMTAANTPPAAGAAPVAAVDPATLLLLIDAVLKVVSLFRRKPA